MISTITKKKVIVSQIFVTKLERFMPFEIKLPANVKAITGILVTASGSGLINMERLGTISFQSNDKSDVFVIWDVREAGLELSDEGWIGVEDPGFDSVMAWITGNLPKFKSVNIEGDNSAIAAWFKGEHFQNPYRISVYLEYEEVEKLIEVVPDQVANAKPKKPKEVFL
jgi:hypothetical protein